MVGSWSADINWKESQKYTRGIYCIKSNLMSKILAFYPNIMLLKSIL